jgi:hypothetical protein
MEDGEDPALPAKQQATPVEPTSSGVPPRSISEKAPNSCRRHATRGACLGELERSCSVPATQLTTQTYEDRDLRSTVAIAEARACACRSDLLANGIDLARAGHESLCRLVRLHLDYFQLMLGYDAAPAEIVALFERIGTAAAQRCSHAGTGGRSCRMCHE